MGLASQPKIVIGRIEAVPPAKADVMTARALAPLGTLLTGPSATALIPLFAFSTRERTGRPN